MRAFAREIPVGFDEQGIGAVCTEAGTWRSDFQM
jgi:hypothetical protein